MIYVMGSLKNPNIPEVARFLRKNGYDAFDGWFAAGPTADKAWKAYAVGNGWSYKQALASPFCTTAYEFDYAHLVQCKAGVLVMPAGKSAHVELGLLRGWNRPVWILHEGEPPGDEWELMPKLATDMAYSLGELLMLLDNYGGKL